MKDVKYIYIPDGPGLLHRPVKVISWTDRQRPRGSGVGTSIAKNCGGSENRLCETGRSNNEVVLD